MNHFAPRLKKTDNTSAYLVPVEQKAVHEPPHDLHLFTPFCSGALTVLLLKALELLLPIVPGLRIEWNVLLFIQMVVAPVVWWYLSSCLDFLEELYETVPANGACGGIPVLDFVDGVVWYEFLRLMPK